MHLASVHRIPAVLRRYHWTPPGNITLPIGVNGGTFLGTVPAGDEAANYQMLSVKMGHTVFDTAFHVHVQLISPIRSSWHLIHLDNIQWLPKTVSSILSISAAVFRRGGADDVPGQKQAGQEARQRHSECGSPSSAGFILLHRSWWNDEETARDPDLLQRHQGWWMSLTSLLTDTSAFLNAPN